jgi:hypothetical protein
MSNVWRTTIASVHPEIISRDGLVTLKNASIEKVVNYDGGMWLLTKNGNRRSIDNVWVFWWQRDEKSENLTVRKLHDGRNASE